MPSPWSDATDRKLLMTIIHLAAPTSAPKWDQVAALMGEGFTAESTRQHFQKMRKECEAQFGKPGTPPGTPAPKSTPRKPKAANGETPSKSGGKRKHSAEDMHDDDEETNGASPMKKQAVKKEEDGVVM